MLVTMSAAVMLPPATWGASATRWRDVIRGTARTLYVELRLRRAVRPDPASDESFLTASDTKLLPAYGQVNGVRVLLPERAGTARKIQPSTRKATGGSPIHRHREPTDNNFASVCMGCRQLVLGNPRLRVNSVTPR